MHAQAERIGRWRIEDLYATERLSISKAVDSRQLEFATGRGIARSLLASVGIENQAIPVGTLREPVWQKNIVGSITHEYPCCVVAIAMEPNIRGLGIDLAPQVAPDTSLTSEICTAEEIKLLDELPALPGIHKFMLVFSIKEALFKCLFPHVQEFFEFKDVNVELDLEEESASIKFNNTGLLADICLPSDLRVKFCFPENYIFSTVVL